MDFPNINQLVYWIEERERIRLAKSKDLPKPWSQDPIFQNTYFCNVYREADKVTQYIRQTYNAAGLPTQAAAPSMALARMVNKPASLAAMGWPWHRLIPYGTWRHTMAQKGAWNGAYIVSTNGRSEPKHEYIYNLLKENWYNLRRVDAFTLKGSHGQIMKTPGFGSFMAAQVVADLKNTKGHPLQQAPDWWTWCAHGPGSLRGMAWVLGLNKVTPSAFNSAMPLLHEQVAYELPTSITDICAQDLQNCLCEFDKYMRVKTGTGRSKRGYNGQN